jgi:hypothetical protein
LVFPHWPDSTSKLRSVPWKGHSWNSLLQLTAPWE